MYEHLTSEQFTQFNHRVHAVLNGKAGAAESLMRFVFRTRRIPYCNKKLGELQLQLGSSERGLRLLDAQLLIKLTVKRTIQQMVSRELCNV